MTTITAPAAEATEIRVNGMTADQHRAEAQRSRNAAAESWERSDTDGFLSQWAQGLAAREHDLAAEIAEAGGVSEFPALFDLDGNLVAAKLVSVPDRYSYHNGTRSVWAILASDDPDSRVTAWVNPSHANKSATRRRNMAKKGYTVGTVQAPAKAAMAGASVTSVNVVIRRTDGGFSRDAVIIATDDDLMDY